MKLKRSAYQKLLNWKNSDIRKPLLIRGARQVGKTSLVRMFSKEFTYYAELNLEKSSDRKYFETDDTHKLINGIFLKNDIIDDGKPVLIFIDEIQACPTAIKQLRFIYEQRPDIYVIAAGSLLEFALKEIPHFPVGRIQYLYLFPMNFSEFLFARGNKALSEAYHSVPVPEYAHDTLLAEFHEYAMIGGMPEIVAVYLQKKNLTLLKELFSGLWQSYKDDVEKYASNNTQRQVIRHAIDTAPYEHGRIKFEKFGKSNYRSREMGEAFRALDMARIIRLIYPTNDTEPPLHRNFNKRPRLQFLDIGLLINALNMHYELINITDLNNVAKGRIIEQLLAQEIISIYQEESYTPCFWVREKANSSAELDLVYQYKDMILPVEMKSGKQGRLRSLHQFVELSPHPYAIRLYAGEFNIEKAKTPSGKDYMLMNLPYYLAGKLPEYVTYFIQKI
ncbi:MAG: AAA family ATPase [Bacteroidota bacterium]|nr:AAA family ATPase [Bacteroidota bacterium]